VLNVILLAYRAVAPSTPTASLWSRRRRAAPECRAASAASRARPIRSLLAGLAAILVVLVAGHIIVGYWDLKLYNFTRGRSCAAVIVNDAAAQYPATFLQLEATLGLSGQPRPTRRPSFRRSRTRTWESSS